MIIRKILKRLFLELRFYLYKTISIVISFFIKTDDHTLLFGTTNGKFLDNAKYFYLYLNNQKREKYSIYWITEDRQTLINLKKRSLPVVYKWSLKALFLAMKARYFIVTHSQSNIFPHKKKRTLLINLWHGSPLKKMGFDSFTDATSAKVKQYKDWDYILVAHDMFAPFFHTSLGLVKEKILPLGLPRNEILWKSEQYREALNESIRQKYDMPLGKKIVLYTPTFRDEHRSKKKFYDEVNKFIKKFNEVSQNDHILLLRLHPFDHLDLNLDNYPLTKNVTDYDDIQELFIITDVLITDYSSTMFDFTILQKRIILYLFDFDSYTNSRGGLYFNINDLPFEKTYSSSQLIERLLFSNNKITNIPPNSFNKKCDTNALLIDILEKVK